MVDKQGTQIESQTPEGYPHPISVQGSCPNAVAPFVCTFLIHGLWQIVGIAYPMRTASDQRPRGLQKDIPLPAAPSVQHWAWQWILPKGVGSPGGRGNSLFSSFWTVAGRVEAGRLEKGEKGQEN